VGRAGNLYIGVNIPQGVAEGARRLVSPGSDHGDKIAAWLLYLAARFLRPPPERPLLSRRPGQVPQFLNTGVEA
jgi:hypothetical protein